MSRRELTKKDTGTVYRPTLGGNFDISLWRTFILRGLPEVLGDASKETAFKIGYKLGELLEVKTAQDIVRAILDMKIGMTNPIEEREGFIGVEFAECVTCSGINPPVGETVCDFEVGIVVGAVEKGLGKKVTEKAETLCIGGLGDEVCRVEVKFE